uniref:hypothetical protein n=1 Tax=Streptomyces sp. TG1A-60 TaxID=3129111 RepID=UPI00403FEF31
MSEPPRTGEPVEIAWRAQAHAVVRADRPVEVLAAADGRLRLRVALRQGLCHAHL